MVVNRVQSNTPSAPPRFAAATWSALESMADAWLPFDPASLDGLPAPAQRYLSTAIPAGTPLSTLARIQMDGDIKLGGRWLRFTATQILRAGVGFVWAPVVGGRLVRFVGADELGPDGARIEFRFQGRVPVVRGTGADVRRSAQGRLAAETAVWLPQALTPQAGARWTAIDEERAVVTVDAAGADVDVEVCIDQDGRMRWLGLQRWKDSATPAAYASFGGTVDSFRTADNGVRVAGSGTVGWEWHTPEQADGMFFRYRVTDISFGATHSTGASAP